MDHDGGIKYGPGIRADSDWQQQQAEYDKASTWASGKSLLDQMYRMASQLGPTALDALDEYLRAGLHQLQQGCPPVATNLSSMPSSEHTEGSAPKRTSAERLREKMRNGKVGDNKILSG